MRVVSFETVVSAVTVAVAVPEPIAHQVWGLGPEAHANAIRAHALALVFDVLHDRGAAPGDTWSILFLSDGPPVTTLLHPGEQEAQPARVERHAHFTLPQLVCPMPTTPTSLRDLAHRNGVSPETVAARLGITDEHLALFDRGLATISAADLPHAAARIHWNCGAADVKAAIDCATGTTQDALCVSIPEPLPRP